ncbi:MAG: prenyltransferase/squalene oxidase repeat-containing protein, partial [Thermodesulfobacteriota bacterium]
MASLSILQGVRAMDRFNNLAARSRNGTNLRVAEPLTRRRSQIPPSTGGLESTLREGLRALGARQEPAGFWLFDLEADVTIPAEYLILQRFLERDVDTVKRERITRYIRRRQRPDGGWPLYEGGFSDISATVKAYFALKLSGDSPDEEHMVRARQLILSLGGAAHVNVFTRIMLALYGQIPWRTVPAIPVQIMLLPRWFFFHLDKVSYWSRTVIVTLLVFCSRRTVCRLRPEEGLPELFVSPPEGIRHIDRYVPGRMRKNLLIF